MKLYVGLDVGLEETSLCIVDGEGLTIREVKVMTDPAAIRSAVEGYADRLERVGVEASSLGIWMQKMRTLLTSRKLLKRKLIDLENHIRGALRAYGLLVGGVARGAFEARVRELIDRSDPIFAMTVEAMLDVRRAILEGYDRLHRVLLQVVQHDAVCRRLMTVPGVGPVAALSFKVGVDEPHRFARSRTVGAHFGLAPRRHQSGTSIDYEGRISKQGDVAVREALCEAAASLLLRVRKWSALRAWGLRIAKRSSMLCAITAVARKLASILHRMWVSETDFHVGFGAKITQRLRLKPAR
ncbi:IS110 family transposase [Bradyrhizobium diversitatis]|uniref:IS110 family transposase n=1 Tax=Bradyrhizobium diversitatis TaxID=2755406 RepID=A0ABS0P7S3_9BRAD|nr:IS110 family transposase [Bradyrhizobium diversitatis]MBH5389344.1 IS110 family transposase [Bradyrhizobium diversitatis]